MARDEAATAFQEFVAIIKALRTPGTGCPWDLEQDHRTLRPYLVEETYEVLDAIERGDDQSFREELGDLLLQVVLHAQVADDRGAFGIRDVIRGIADKMVRRHPHVFGSVKVSGSAEVSRNWDQIKAAESQGKGGASGVAAALAGLPEGLPALHRAQRLGEKAAKVGCDGTSVAEFLAGVRQGFAELEQAIASAAASEWLEQELGDVLFSLCQLARCLGLNAEDSLRDCNRRFVDRFRRMEERAPRALQELSDEERQDALRHQAQEADRRDASGRKEDDQGP